MDQPAKVSQVGPVELPVSRDSETDTEFLLRVEELLSSGPPRGVLPDACAEMLDCRLELVDEVPTAVVRYFCEGRRSMFRCALDCPAWTSRDAQQVAQLVWSELAASRVSRGHPERE